MSWDTVRTVFVKAVRQQGLSNEGSVCTMILSLTINFYMKKKKKKSLLEYRPELISTKTIFLVSD